MLSDYTHYGMFRQQSWPVCLTFNLKMFIINHYIYVKQKQVFISCTKRKPAFWSTLCIYYRYPYDTSTLTHCIHCHSHHKQHISSFRLKDSISQCDEQLISSYVACFRSCTRTGLLASMVSIVVCEKVCYKMLEKNL